MKDMFYNYDNHLDEKHTKHNKHCDCEDTQCNGVSLLTNVKGEVLGFKAKQNSTFQLFFNLSGNVDQNPVAGFIREGELFFDVTDRMHNVIYSAPVQLFGDSACVEIISSDQGPLKYGNYKMHLYSIVDGIKYTFFAENDGILSIE